MLKLLSYVAMALLGTALTAAAQQAAVPTFSIPGGTYNSVQSVTLSDTSANATIYYTVNGTTPTTASTQYSNAIVNPATISAFATAPGYAPSPVVTETFTLIALPPVFSVPGGSYTTAQSVMITTQSIGVKIFYTTEGSTPSVNSTLYNGPVSIATTETLKAIAAQTHFTSSAVTSASYQMGAPAATPVLTPAPGTFTQQQTVTITDPTPNSVLYYTLDGSTPTVKSTRYYRPILINGSTTIEAVAVSSTTGLSAIGGGAYTITTTPPTITPGYGGAYQPIQVTITDQVAGAAIYYTPDGSTPTIASIRYTAPFTLTQSKTVFAIAVASGRAPSAPTGHAYLIELVEHVVGSEQSLFGTHFPYTGPVGDGGPPLNALLDPYDMVFDSAGDMLITDYAGNRIRKVDAGTGQITTIAGMGPYGIIDVNAPQYTGDGGLATNALIYGPTGLALDSQGNIFISDTRNNVVRKISASTGIITTYAGHHVFNGVIDGGLPATSVDLNGPLGLAIDANDNLFIVESGENVVHKVDPATGIITTVAGLRESGPSGGVGTYSSCPDWTEGVPALEAKFCTANSVAVDSQGNLFVSDGLDDQFSPGLGNAVRLISASTGFATTAIAHQQGMKGLAFNQDGELFATSLSSILKRLPNGTVFRAATSFPGGPPDGAGPDQVQFFAPQGVAFDGAGNLYYSERSDGNNVSGGIYKIPYSASVTPLFY